MSVGRDPAPAGVRAAPDRAPAGVRAAPDRARGGRSAARDRGSATAEIAAALPALVLLLVVGLSGIGAVTTQLRCVDAARDAALAVARGEDGEAAGRRVAPPGATIVIRVDGGLARATVRANVRPLGRHLPGLTVEATAVAAVEPGGVTGGGAEAFTANGAEAMAGVKVGARTTSSHAGPGTGQATSSDS